MKQLTLEETKLKEEMKLSYYENDLDMFKMVCHLEDFEIQYQELDKQNHELKRTIKINERSRRKMQQSLVKEIHQLKDNWNTLWQYILDKDNRGYEKVYTEDILNKMQELEQGSDSDE